ncbi:hypothetical protein L9F63_009151, partial [Diploptera punctata]
LFSDGSQIFFVFSSLYNSNICYEANVILTLHGLPMNIDKNKISFRIKCVFNIKYPVNKSVREVNSNSDQHLIKTTLSCLISSQQRSASTADHGRFIFDVVKIFILNTSATQCRSAELLHPTAL